MLRQIVLVVLVGLATGNFTEYNYPYYQLNSSDVGSFYWMPNMVAGQNIVFKLNFFKDNGYGPTEILLKLGTSSFGLVSPQPASFVLTTIQFNTNMTFAWTVATSGDFYLYIEYTLPLTSMVPFYFIVEYADGTEIGKHVNILRNNRNLKLLYLSSSQDLTIACGVAICDFHPMLTDPSNYKLDTKLTATNSSGQTSTYAGLAPGYYLIVMNAFSQSTLYYSSDSYDCPYDANTYPDPWKLFQPCVPVASGSSTSEEA